MENTSVYVTALLDSLKKKQQVLERLLALTKEQNELLNQSEVDADRFEEILGEKDGYIKEIVDLNKGFERVFASIGTSLQDQKENYRSEIVQMQNLIRVVTDQGVALERLERENKEIFTSYLRKNREEIATFNKSNHMANTYHQNMANQHREWQSYFMDSKQ